MTDEFLGAAKTMDVAAVQKFLDAQSGILKKYRTRDVNGKEKSAAEIFVDTANKYNMNVKVLLALVEKEQSLLSNPKPSEKSLNWATGFGPYGHARYGGFGAQIHYAGKVLAPGGDYDRYQDHYKSFQIGKTTV